MAAVSLIESVMKFAIAVFSAAHAPSSRRALLFAQAALAVVDEWHPKSFLDL